MLSKKNRTRIVSFLGLGPQSEPPHYHPSAYQFNSQVSQPTPLVQAALLELLDSEAKLVLFGTQAAKQRWLDTHLLYQYVSAKQVHFRPSPDGRTQEELNEIFNQIHQALTPTCMHEWEESEAPQEIIVDVTHGFRIQPMIALAAVSFVQSEWQRKALGNPPTLRVLYGAFEARSSSEPASAPIWDLSPFLNFARWNDAFNALLRFGQAEDLKQLTQTLSQTERKKLENPRDLTLNKKISWLNTLGTRAQDFSLAVSTLRTFDLMEKKSFLLSNILEDSRAHEWLTQFPVLREPVEELLHWSQHLQAKSLLSREGLQALSQLIQYSLKSLRYQQALTLLNEGIVLYWTLLHEAQPEELTQRSVKELTKRHSANLRKISGKENFKESNAFRNLAEPLQNAACLDAGLNGIRNDVAHAGLRDNPIAASRIREKLQNAAQEFAELIQHMPKPGTYAKTNTAERVFLNLSNHPVSTWSPQQLETARQEFGEPRDLPDWNSQIDPKDKTSTIVQQAESCVDQVLRYPAQVSDVFVAGEPTFSTVLVALLQKQDIHCWVTTTQRKKVEIPLSEEAIQTQSTFQFESWREYPDLQRLLKEEE